MNRVVLVKMCLGLLLLVTACGGGSATDSDGTDSAPNGESSTSGDGTVGQGGPPRDTDTDQWTLDETPVPMSGVGDRVGLLERYSCALDAQNIVQCDESYFHDRDDPPAVPLTTFSVGARVTAGLDASGNLYLWSAGFDYEAPEGTFKAVAAGDNLFCGIRPEGNIECFGDEENSAFTPPEGNFIGISMQDDIGCAIREDGAIQCWGARREEYPGNFIQVSASLGHICGITQDNALECPESESTLPEGKYRSVATVTGTICAVNEYGRIVCGGRGLLARLVPPFGAFKQVEIYGNVACAVDAAGEKTCWGEDYNDGQVPLDCELEQAVLSGSAVDGTWPEDYHVEGPWGFDMGHAYGLNAYRFIYELEDWSETDAMAGIVVLEGNLTVDAADPVDAFDYGQNVEIGRALLQVNPTRNDPGQFFCSSEGSTFSPYLDEIRLDLQNVHSIGGCSGGTPVDGFIRFEDGDHTGTITATLDGVTPNLKYDGMTCMGGAMHF